MSKDAQSKNLATKLRFLVVGSFNTLFDFAMLFAFTSLLHMAAIPANITSTTIAFIVSFFLNRNFTFRSDGANVRRQFILFALVTLFGLWVIQTIIIAILTPLGVSLGLSQPLSLLGSKLVATIASLIWNYTLYARVVFRQ